MIGRGWKNSENHGRKIPDCLEQTVDKNMDTKCLAGEEHGR